MSSQAICKACMLLEGLNKNRPRISVEVGEEEEGRSTLAKRMEGVALAGGSKLLLDYSWHPVTRDSSSRFGCS